MFKDKLKELREKAGLSQQMLADKLFVSRSAIAKWENGNGIPSDVNLDAICEFFNVEEEWLIDREELKETIKSVDKKSININIIFYTTIGLLLTFCLIIGGRYLLHRIAIVFSVLYFVFKFFLKDTKLNRLIYLLAFVISFILSIFNWISSGFDLNILTGVDSLENFYAYNNIMIFEDTLLHVSTKTLNLILSQLSSILNIFMLLSVNIIYLIINKKDRSCFRNIIISLVWTIIDFIGLILPVIFIVATFSKTMDICHSAICHTGISYFIISHELGIFTMIPLVIYLTTIVLSFVDMLMKEEIINNSKNKFIKILMLVFLGISLIAMPLSWYLSSPLNSPF